ncbi:MAG TPA: hypothetical protein PLW65_03040 [Pseudomonadota bacterium]|nr:hypothetical protein [Pseudomonadota bacterium]
MQPASSSFGALAEPLLSSSPSAASPAESWTVAWYVWVTVLSVVCSIFGVQWDISWHRSIGRDTFWSPPHLAIYLGAVLAGLACGYQILTLTFGHRRDTAATVRIWGLRGPLGAFISAWGGLAMLASAPFDNWWHNAYGLDVKILSPPHSVLALGLFGLELGALIFLAGLMNRASGRTQALLRLLFLAIGAFVLIGFLTFQMEFIRRSAQHSGLFYRIIATCVPLCLCGIGRASGHRFGATIVAAMYTVEMLLILWLFPLFPATPKLGPVYQVVTHMIPAGFPLLLIFPALCLDLLTPRVAGHPPWQQSVVLAAGFLCVFLAVQWPFAEFLLSPGARNWIFGAHYFGFATRSTFPDFRHVFIDLDGALGFRRQLGLAALAALLSVRLGLSAARFLRGVQR